MSQKKKSVSRINTGITLDHSPESIHAIRVRQHRGKKLVQGFKSRSSSWNITLSCKFKCSCYHPQGTTFFPFPVVSLHIPDLTEQGGKFVVVHPPGREHLCMVVVECSQLCQTAQETSKVLRLRGMLQGTKLPQHVQHGLLKSLNSLLILHIRPVWGRSMDFN